MANRKILYLEGRPRAHTLHRRLALSVGCDIEFIDPKIRWQDQDKPTLINFVGWIRNAWYLAKKYKEYSIFLVDNLHFTPVLMNLLFVKDRKRLIVHLGSHTLYFMYAQKFSRINLWLHKKMLQHYDVLLCEGNMARYFAESLLAQKLPQTYVTFLGPPSERFPALRATIPDFNSNKIIIIANGPSHFRLYYKGLDVMIRAFSKASRNFPSLQLHILGEWSDEIIRQLLKDLDAKVIQQITFKGQVSNIQPHLIDAGLCLHCTRGDAFPTSTLEAMAAGVPTLVSEWTGTKEVIEQVDKRLIVPFDEDEIGDRICWYYQITKEERSQLSVNGKRIAANYTEENAIIHYRNTFEKIYKDLGV